MSLPAPDAMDVVLARREPFQSSGRALDTPRSRGVGSHRLALQRMAGDLLSLRRRVASLEAENGHLRHSLARLREPAPLRHSDTDVLTRDELLDRLKNDREKELVLLQRCHRQQQVALRRCQDRVAKARALEQALRQQEKASAGLGRQGRVRGHPEPPGVGTGPWRGAGDTGDSGCPLLR
ncbi:hypothetical protein DUI87_29351 [Hirundo rustica rustica]|uniref:Uncharacterized protein n=1 Tax=Hirundo rustica rustica TaxID=333673 RepID=A0A3M0J6X7_HIRRU|nr:hypothetical protein DUI87_29351 [Hirundo rustica rustica]